MGRFSMSDSDFAASQAAKTTDEREEKMNYYAGSIAEAIEGSDPSEVADKIWEWSCYSSMRPRCEDVKINSIDRTVIFTMSYIWKEKKYTIGF